MRWRMCISTNSRYAGERAYRQKAQAQIGVRAQQRETATREVEYKRLKRERKLADREEAELQTFKTIKESRWNDLVLTRDDRRRKAKLRRRQQQQNVNKLSCVEVRKCVIMIKFLSIHVCVTTSQKCYIWWVAIHS